MASESTGDSDAAHPARESAEAARRAATLRVVVDFMVILSIPRNYRDFLVDP